MAENKKIERTVIHFQNRNKHSYYGNLRALFDNVDERIVGYSYNYVRNKFVDKNLHELVTKTGCVIRKGVLVTTKNKKGEASQPKFSTDTEQ
jgi:hypothetical protein